MSFREKQFGIKIFVVLVNYPFGFVATQSNGVIDSDYTRLVKVFCNSFRARFLHQFCVFLYFCTQQQTILLVSVRPFIWASCLINLRDLPYQLK